MEWKGFAKIWLWVLFIFHILGIAGSCVSVFTGKTTAIGYVSIAITIISLCGIYLLLFNKKKIGLYITTGAYVVSAVESVLVNGTTGISAAVAGIIGIAILWFAVKNYISSLE